MIKQVWLILLITTHMDKHLTNIGENKVENLRLTENVELLRQG